MYYLDKFANISDCVTMCVSRVLLLYKCSCCASMCDTEWHLVIKLLCYPHFSRTHLEGINIACTGSASNTLSQQLCNEVPDNVSIGWQKCHVFSQFETCQVYAASQSCYSLNYAASNYGFTGCPPSRQHCRHAVQRLQSSLLPSFIHAYVSQCLPLKMHTE